MTDWPSAFRLRWVANLLRQGGVVGYPTEAVYGLGCDPLNADAFQRLLAIKNRPLHKGVILIAAEFSQLTPFIRPLPPAMEQQAHNDWPGPVTWLLPARAEVPDYLTGGRDTVATRVTDHPIAAALCRAFGGALVSTSANHSGFAPARSALRTRLLFGDRLDYVLGGATGGLERPTPIRDGRTGKYLRT